MFTIKTWTIIKVLFISMTVACATSYMHVNVKLTRVQVKLARDLVKLSRDTCSDVLTVVMVDDNHCILYRQVVADSLKCIVHTNVTKVICCRMLNITRFYSRNHVDFWYATDKQDGYVTHKAG